MHRVQQRVLKLFPSRPLTLEWLIVGLFLVIMVGFGISYTRLLYERHQAHIRLQLAQEEVRREELRYHELEKLYRQATNGGDIFVAQYAPRLLRRAAPGTEVWLFPEEDTAPQRARLDGKTKETSLPVWKQWLHVLFHREGP